MRLTSKHSIDKKKRKKLKQLNKNYIIYKAFLNEHSLYAPIRWNLSYRTYNFKHQVNISFIKNYCLKTARSRSVIRKFHLSRLAIRSYQHNNFNYQKYTW